jgi:hypothetical protein
MAREGLLEEMVPGSSLSTGVPSDAQANTVADHACCAPAPRGCPAVMGRGSVYLLQTVVAKPSSHCFSFFNAQHYREVSCSFTCLLFLVPLPLEYKTFSWFVFFTSLSPEPRSEFGTIPQGAQ